MLKVEYKFELCIPKDKSEIPTTSYTSCEENDSDDMEEEDYYNLHSDRGMNDSKQLDIPTTQK
jgi:hypothetical protein